MRQASTHSLPRRTDDGREFYAMFATRYNRRNSTYRGMEEQRNGGTQELGSCRGRTVRGTSPGVVSTPQERQWSPRGVLFLGPARSLDIRLQTASYPLLVIGGGRRRRHCKDSRKGHPESRKRADTRYAVLESIKHVYRSSCPDRGYWRARDTRGRARLSCSLCRTLSHVVARSQLTERRVLATDWSRRTGTVS